MSTTTNYNDTHQPPSKFKTAASYGLLLGLGLLALSIISYLFLLWENKIYGYLNWVLIIIAIVFGIKKYRDEVCGGFISYSSALGFGVLMVFLASIIASAGNSIYLAFVDDTFIVTTLEQTEVQMLENNTPEDQVAVAMNWTRKIMSPIGIFIMGIIATTFFGFIVSLVASAFLKKEADSFENS